FSRCLEAPTTDCAPTNPASRTWCSPGTGCARASTLAASKRPPCLACKRRGRSPVSRRGFPGNALALAGTRGKKRSEMRTDLPRYIDRGGDIVIRQPLALCGTTSYSFILSADLTALTALVDRLLNAPANGKVKYVPAGPFVVLLCADIEQGQAEEEP